MGRRASLDGLGLDDAGVAYGRGGVVVDRNLRTNRRNIYAAGDCTGGYQFTHYAGFQGFMAVRNAFLPFSKKAVLEQVPWATFTDPEEAHVGLTEAQAKERHGDKALVYDWPMAQVDRAVAEGDSEGFIKLVYLPNGRLLGATIVASRAGEMIHEWSLALDRGLKLSQLAHSVHVYPTYSLATQQVAVRLTMDRMLGGAVGRVLRKAAKMAR
jgi:pyruvate/2-oxoglutarate dehydrogenase complex dihydrolipoamide dehydrogenase (E3) component